MFVGRFGNVNCRWCVSGYYIVGWNLGRYVNDVLGCVFVIVEIGDW